MAPQPGTCGPTLDCEQLLVGWRICSWEVTASTAKFKLAAYGFQMEPTDPSIEVPLLGKPTIGSLISSALAQQHSFAK
ncbi:hypothetical protein D3C86_1955820 [compost metagenome]